MNKTLLALLVLTFGIGIYVLSTGNKMTRKVNSDQSYTQTTKSQQITTTPLTIIAEGLDTPWAMAFLPDRSVLVTERPGRVRLINTQGVLQSKPVATLSSVKEVGEGGLLGIVLHPNFEKNHFVYLYYTYSSSNDNTLNRVVRMKYENNTLSSEQILVDAIPGAANHNGGRIKFGPDNMLYITTGDAQEPSRAQDTNSLAGKILRVTDEGKPAPGNPFNNEVYSYGHRNPQGIAWDSTGQLWATEHGRSGVQSGLDELNKIEKGKNYGWSVIQGSETKSGMVTAFLNSGSTTWAPAGLAFFNNSLFFGGLRGQTLYEVQLSIPKTIDHFAKEYGRIREVILGPDNMLYFSTSNRDGRGIPGQKDDKIIRVDPQTLQ